MSQDWSRLELSEEAMRALVDAAMDRVVKFVGSLAAQPAADLEGAAEAARQLIAPLPEGSGSLEQALSLLFDRAVSKGFNTAGPGYLAYIPGGGIFASAVADLVADAVNRYVGVWLAAPALVQLEVNVVRWFCDLAGYPAGAGGFLTTGGSLANFSALAAARRERLPEDFLSGTLYVSTEAHHSVRKAALLAGFPAASVRSVPVDGSYRMRLDMLRAALGADRAQGRRPFLVVANAGSTNTGAVDDLAGLAEVAASEGLWLHVDAAYGGFFLLTERGRARLRGIERADSITLDPHKGLFLPYGNGCLLVRDADSLKRTHSVPADYLPPLQHEPGRVDFSEISPELSRDFRGLRVWLPLQLHGAAAFRRALDEKLDLACWVADELRRVPGIEIVAEPQLSIVAFRLVRGDGGGAALDALNRELMERINARHRVYLSGTTLPCGFVLRICVLSFRTHRDRLQQALEDVRASVAELPADHSAP